jgi:transcription factor E
MQIKFLKSIVETLTNKQSVAIVDLLVDKKDVNEFLIAKKLGLTINQTRNILYKLSDFGLVSFMRKKDKRKGWYIYFWTLNVTKSLDLLEQKLREELARLESQLKSRIEKRYYFCKTCNLEVTEEAALLNDFICSECEEVYELFNNKMIIEKLEKEISKLEKEVQFILEEKAKEQEKNEGIQSRKSKRAEKKKEKAKKLIKKKSSKKIKVKKKKV